MHVSVRTNDWRFAPRNHCRLICPRSAGAFNFALKIGSFDYVDVMGERITARERLELRHIVLGGRLWHSAETKREAA